MSRICGYRCEHNKSGICQISVCDKKSNISDKTEVQTFTRHTDPTITELQQENKQLKKAYDKEKYLTDKLTKQLTDEYKNTEIQYKLKNEYKNIIDELEKWLKGYWELLSGMPDIQEQAQMDILHEVSDKIKELKGNNNGKN